MLIQQGRAPKVVDKLDELTDKILDLAGDPTKEGGWARRGLVLGDVQSGKTGTYLGLFNKAADAGYRLFILLAGNTEVLRQQTQARIDESFIGRDSSTAAARKGVNVTPRRYIGVGRIRRDLAQASGMTTVLSDFKTSSQEATNITIQTNAAHPYVFVVKKNKQILRQNNHGTDTGVYRWLREQAHESGGKLTIPVLVLDDESDYASVNTKTKDDPTAINSAVRDLLSLFTRSSYIAFTATPFANIFIDHNVENDLFPRDFVYSLEPPTNYVGSARTFGTADAVKTEAVIDLEDLEDSVPLGHKSSLQLRELEQSLIDAVDAFLLSNAIRDLRGDTDKPRSMLVNVSRFKKVQKQISELLEDSVAETKNAIELHIADAGTLHEVITRLRNRFDDEYGSVEFDWDEIRATLDKSTSDVRVRLFNSDTDKALIDQETEWDRPPRLIAVGGDVLSRGLTVEGLCVTYFYRRVTASDTLMQMARWFGYRDGYEDLCRIWINADAADNYRFAADSIDELRTDLRLMLRQNLTPADFGLAVQKHPNSLLITAKNKMKSAAEVRRTIGLSGRRLETTSLLPDQTDNRSDLELLVNAAEQNADYDPSWGQWNRWLDIDREIIADFLEQYGTRAPLADFIFSGNTLAKWVRSTKSKRWKTWDMALANGTKQATRLTFGRDRTVLAPVRGIREDRNLLRVSGKSRRLAGPTDLAHMLSRGAREDAERDFRSVEKSKSIPEDVYYPFLERPALIIYPLIRGEASDVEEEGKSSADSGHEYLVAVKVAIPGERTQVRMQDADITYVINTVAQESWLTEFSVDDDEDVDE
jgi:hypothetical protein